MEAPMIYSLRKPKQIDPNKTYPALFLIHGIGSNEQNMFPLAEGLEEQFYIFSIRGPLTQPPGFAYFTIEGYGKPHRDVFKQAVSKLTSFIDYASEQYSLDRNQLYLLGFSQGAILSMSLALTMGSRIKGIVALSGYIPNIVTEDYDVKPVNELSAFISHGEMDQILPYQWGVQAQEYFKQLGANVSFQTYQEGHTVSLQNQQDFKKWILDRLEN
ncbi:dienelactone hydrolase family protein [Bacillus sp. V3B]|uniref:alpha/beta hydrolase n=1 Tax=Bacillus sp. V3B TaxID=2804915 RepID=UPI00210CDBA1|nr:alpha/beta hydrolase-fold protein [Bacillus sp. V3B]MCQ6274497.1 dienelactone hydrolase family protein [Bacillus sp. V3B]